MPKPVFLVLLFSKALGINDNDSIDFLTQLIFIKFNKLNFNLLVRESLTRIFLLFSVGYTTALSSVSPDTNLLSTSRVAKDSFFLILGATIRKNESFASFSKEWMLQA